MSRAVRGTLFSGAILALVVAWYAVIAGHNLARDVRRWCN